MFNFNEQGKFESHEIAKEHSQSLEGNQSDDSNPKITKDIVIAFFAINILIISLITWLM